MKKILQFFVVTLCIFVCGGISHAAMPTEWVGDFDGTDDYVDIPIEVVNNLDSVATVSFWVKPAADTATYVGWLYGPNAGNKQFSMWRQSATAVYFAVDSDGTGAQANFALSQVELEGSWHHYVMVITGTQVKAYWDGVYKTAFNFSDPIPSVTSLKLGAWSAGHYEGGQFEDFRLYDRALSATEVSNLYDGKSMTSGLVANYPLSEGAGAIIYDAVGEKQSAEHSVNSGNADTTDWADDDFDGTPNGVSPYGDTFNFSIGTGNGFKGNYLIAENVSGGRFYADNTIGAGVWADIKFKASGTGSLQIYNVHTGLYETIGTLTSSVETFTYRIKTYGGGRVILKNSLTTNIDELSIKEVLPPAHATLTNADTSSPGDVGSFWQEDTAGGNNFKNGYSDGLLAKTAGRTYAANPTAYGEWEFDFYKDGYEIDFAISQDTERNVNSYTILATNILYFRKYVDSGSTQLFSTAASYLEYNTWYRLRMVRNSITNEFVTGAVGTFAMYIKGRDGHPLSGDDWELVDTTGGSGSNPVTDNTYTTSNYFVNDLDVGDQVSNLKINGKSVPLHEFTDDTGTFDEIFIPAQGRFDALGGEKEHASRKIQWEPPMEWVGDFDGTDDYVIKSGLISSLDGSSAVSMCVTFTPDSSSGNEYIISVPETSSGSNGFDLGRNGTTVNAYVRVGGSHVQGSVSGALTYGTQATACVTYDGANAKTYVNGTLGDTDAAVGVLEIASDELNVGRFGSYGGFFEGEIHDAMLYNRTLTLQEVVDYNNKVNMSSDGLLIHYPFSEGAGTTVYDVAPTWYGDELVTNGTFENTNNWTIGEAGVDFSVSNGQGQIAYNNTTNYGNIYQTVATVSGYEYELSLDVSQLSTGANSQRVTIGTSSGGNSTLRTELSVGENTYRFTADATNAYLAVKLESGDKTDATPLIFDNVSLREVFSPAHGTIMNASVTAPGESGSFWQARDEGDTPNRDNGFSAAIVAKTDGAHYFPSTQAYGVWEFDFKKDDASVINIGLIAADNETSANLQDVAGHFLRIDSGEEVRLLQGDPFSGGFVTVSGYIENNTWYKMKVVRNTVTDEYVAGAVGTFAVYIKGGSFGDDYVLVDVTGGTGTNPITDNTHTTSKYFVADLDAGDGIANVKVGTAFLPIHDFIPGTGTANKLFIPARVGSRVLDALGWELEKVPQKYFRTLSQMTAIQEAALAVSNVRYWIPAMRQFFIGQAGGTVLSPSETSEELTTAARTALHSGNSATEGVNYWDKEVKTFFRGLADGSLQDFLTWFAAQ